MNKKAEIAKKLWNELRKSVSKKHNPFEGMTKQQAIDKIRKVREEIWDEKLAARH